jgi:hypothetical protein
MANLRLRPAREKPHPSFSTSPPTRRCADATSRDACRPDGARWGEAWVGAFEEVEGFGLTPALRAAERRLAPPLPSRPPLRYLRDNVSKPPAARGVG